MAELRVRPHPESERLAALASFQILDTPAEGEFDFLARLAADFCGTSMAGITFIGADRQFYKSAVGMPREDMPREESFCQYVVSTDGPVVVEDATADQRFLDSPLVTGETGIRSYAGAPLRTHEGHVLGALCVMDKEPHAIEPGKVKTLEGLARQAAALLERRRHAGELSDARLRLGYGERLAHVGTWDWDVENDAGEVTREFDRILGREPGTMSGLESFLDQVVDEDRGRVAGTLEAAVASRSPYSFRARIVRPDGEIRTIDSEAEPQHDEHGDFIGFHGAIVDVTELVRAEARSREQADGLRAAFETALDAIFVFDDRQAFTHVNSAACDLLGYELAELLAMGVSDVVSDRTRPQADAALRTLAERGKLRGEIELERADGTLVLSEFAATRDFRPGLHLAILRDVTERERAAYELRLQAEVLDQVPAGIIASDADRTITQWSRGATDLLGISRGQALGLRVEELDIVPPQSRHVRREMERRVGGAGASWEGEIELRGADGRIFPALVTNSPVRDESGEIDGYVGVVIDLSDQRRAELDLRRSRIETIHRLARAVETRDLETGDHIERIAAFSAVLAEKLELDPDRVELLRIAAPMHDVGKIGIADSILLKPGRLTDEERAEMERHAEIGHRILAGSGSLMLEVAATIALTHHEWMDGSGYPHGLSGAEIPIEGRIVAVADVFDALTSDRVYRPAFSVEEALEMMEAEGGTHFDPVVLDAMLAELDAILAIRHRLGNGVVRTR